MQEDSVYLEKTTDLVWISFITPDIWVHTVLCTLKNNIMLTSTVQ
jgi:hypothetical protein